MKRQNRKFLSAVFDFTPGTAGNVKLFFTEIMVIGIFIWFEGTFDIRHCAWSNCFADADSNNSQAMHSDGIKHDPPAIQVIGLVGFVLSPADSDPQAAFKHQVH